MRNDKKAENSSHALRKKIGYLRMLAAPLRREGKRFVLLSALLYMAVIPTSQVLSTLLPKAAVDSMSSGKRVFETLQIIICFAIALLALAAVRSVLSRLAGISGLRYNYALQKNVLTKWMQLDYVCMDQPDSFAQFAFSQQNYANQSQNVLTTLISILGSFVTIIAMGSIILQAGPALCLISFGIVFIQSFLSIPIARITAELAYKTIDLARPLSYISRIMLQKENMIDLRISNAGNIVLHQHQMGSDKITQFGRSVMKKALKYEIPNGLLSAIQSPIIIAYLVLFFVRGDVTKLGLYLSLTAAAVQLSSSLNSVFSNIGSVAGLLANAELIARFFSNEPVIEKDTGITPPSGSFSLEFHDVSFRYPDSDFCIDNFDLKVGPGQRIALVGENGAGKTTLLKLLLRLFDPDNGAVLVNGEDIRSYAAHDYRMRIGVALQDVRILSLSLRNNMIVYGDATDDQIRRTLIEFGLENVLQRAGDDLDTMVSREFNENGIVLSGGEAQRLAISRLFLREFGVLLLDEPTAALDPFAEAHLMELLEKKADTTIIMVAHRLSTVLNFDQICYIEHGRVVERGNHDELMSLKGRYYSMFMRQAEKYDPSFLNNSSEV
jgi:ATP-binding cassette subfamily B protein